jgi:NADPH:quinone reductase-like Zn-dependent oxidoreductase
VTPRRTALPAAYNQYSRLKALGDHREDDHDWWPVYRPLFLTGWLIADQFEDEDDFDAETIIVSGASSKTALAFAHVMKARGTAPRLVALASSRSAAFTADTGLYDQVVDYGAIDTIEAEGKVALVDFAGNPAATRAVHERFGDALAVDMVVGITHWDAERGGAPLPGPRPIGFFAPGRMKKRSKDWGAHGLRRQSEDAWLDFMPTAKRLTAIERRSGGEAALAAYRDAVAGNVDPRIGLLIEP